MNKTLKTILASIFIVVVSFGGLVYYASTQISDKEIHSYTVKILEDIFPGADVVVGKVNISLGTSVRVGLEKLSLTLKNKSAFENDELVSLKDVDVRIPVFSILKNGGVVSIQIDDPKMGFYNLNETSNWNLATGKKKALPPGENEKRKNVSINEERKKTVIPSFIKKSKVNIKVTDLILDYIAGEQARGRVKLDKILLKNIGFREASAFEVKSQIKTILQSGEEIRFNSLIIGDFDIKDYLDQQELKSSIVIDLTNLVMPGLKRDIDNVKANINLDVKKKETNVSLNVIIAQDSTLESKIKIVGDTMKVQDLKGSIGLDYLKSIVLDPDFGMEANKSRLSFEGSLTRSGKKIIQDLKFKISPSFVYLLPDSVKAKVDLSGSYIGEAINMNSRVEMQGGRIDTKVSSKLDINNIPDKIEKFSPVKVNVEARELKLTKTFIRNFLYDPSGARPSASVKSIGAEDQPKKSSDHLPKLPNILTNISWKEISIGGEDFQGLIKTEMADNQINIFPSIFNYSAGEGKVSAKVDLSPGIFSISNLNLNLKNFNLDGLHPFLPPNIDGIKGNFNGLIKGSITSGATLKHDLVVDLAATDGEIKGFNLKEPLDSLIAKIPLLQDQVGANNKEVKINENFSVFKLKGQLSHDKYSLNNLIFKGIDKQVELEGKGVIFPLSQTRKSFLELELLDKTGKISKPLVKNIGIDKLPIRLEGIGFALKPDYEYSLKRLARSYKTKTKDKLKEKAKNKVEEKAKDLIKKNKEDIKKIFKSIF